MHTEKMEKKPTVHQKKCTVRPNKKFSEFSGKKRQYIMTTSETYIKLVIYYFFLKEMYLFKSRRNIFSYQ